MEPPSPPRYAPQVPLPPYRYVPGRAPHPTSDPAGHSYGRPVEVPPPLDPARWRDSAAYLHGVDLYNAGFWWEAHEAWEGLWRLAGRSSETGRFLQGLIKAAAGLLKSEVGQHEGAAQFFREAASHLSDAPERYLGLDVPGLRAAIESCRIEAEAGRAIPPDRAPRLKLE